MAYPPSDDLLRKIFRRKLPAEAHVDTYYLLCFGILFDCVASGLKAAATHTGEKLLERCSGWPRKHLATSWRNYLEFGSNRERLWQTAYTAVVTTFLSVSPAIAH